MRHFLCAILLVIAATPAHAITGAELLRTDERYARGYLWGALTSYLVLVSSNLNSESDAPRARRLKCIQTSNIDDGTFHQAVVAYINRNPTSLAEDAVAPMMRTLIEMCDE